MRTSLSGLRKTNRKMNLGCALCGAFLLLLSTAPIHAQVNTVTILGTVTDTSGGVIPNADVTLTNQGTGVTSAGSTNQSGNYAFRGLVPGVYKITVKASGFETFQETDIPVQVAQTNTRD